MNGASLFCGAGIAETYFKRNNIEIVVASELVPKRCQLHSWLYPDCDIVCGDITDSSVFKAVQEKITSLNCKFLLATPPCQGMSTMGKKNYTNDKRNYLIFYALDMIDVCDFDYILIENVPKFLELYFPYNGEILTLQEIVTRKYSNDYNIESSVLNAKNFGVAQSRPRGFIKIWKKGLIWNNPTDQKEITLKEAIGHLPSLEAGEDSGIKWHYAKPLNERYATAMKHTPEGKSAFLNEIYYPRTADGSRMKGFHNTFARMRWDEPCPARAMNSGNIGSHNNAHPGRPLPDGTRSDARVLTLRELFIVSSLPADWDLPEWCSDQFIREIIGEAIPPKFSEAIIKGIPMKTRLERSMNHRWIIDKNVNSKDILADFAVLMSNSQDGFRLNDLVDQTITQGRSSGTDNVNGSGSTITVGVRLLQAAYYMLGYSYNDTKRSGKKFFMPSPMTLNYISTSRDKATEESRIEQKKNFLVNLFCIQYPNPANRTPSCFEIYAGRLIIKLLLDDRIDRKLYIDECIWFLPFIERINQNTYDILIKEILRYRTMTFKEKKSLFELIPDYEYLFANVTHELNYYVLRLFENFGVFNLVEDRDHNEGNIFRFRHGKGKTFRTDAYAPHKQVSGYVELNPEIIDAAQKLSDRFSAFDTPVKESDEYIFNHKDWLTNLYEIEPLAYLNCISTKIDRKAEVSRIVTEMVNASKFGGKDGKDFENALKPFMELFRQTLDVEIISGAGNTDLLCTMEEQSDNTTYKINIDAKTRSSALDELNAKRLSKHLRKHGSKFCIVVAPKFAHGIADDICGSQIVVIRAEEFGAYCYHECTRANHNGYADFSTIKNIIMHNPGTDITPLVRNITIERYGLSI